MPGFDEGEFQGIQFEVFEDAGLLNVYCYESGFEEDGDCEGMVYPITLTEEDFPLVEDLRTLRILDPTQLEEVEGLPEEDRSRIRDRHERFTDG